MISYSEEFARIRCVGLLTLNLFLDEVFMNDLKIERTHYAQGPAEGKNGFKGLHPPFPIVLKFSILSTKF
jgi:hypothetical protein